MTSTAAVAVAVPGEHAVQDELRCAGCDYALRGLDPAGRCPECNHAIAESIAAHAALDMAARREQHALFYGTLRWLKSQNK